MPVNHLGNRRGRFCGRQPLNCWIVVESSLDWVSAPDDGATPYEFPVAMKSLSSRGLNMPRLIQLTAIPLVLVLVASQCSAQNLANIEKLKREIASLEADKTDLQDQLKNAPPPPKQVLVREIKKKINEISRLKMELRKLRAKKPISLATMANRYSRFDLDTDGTPEINNLSISQFSTSTAGKLNSEDRVVLVLVEKRLINRIPKSTFSEHDLTNRILRLTQDLKREGLKAIAVECDVYAGSQHQDGLTLLALRRFLIDVSKSYRLRGAILVGSFPEASIVRRWIWRTVRNVRIGGRQRRGAEILRIVPEPVAPRAEIVLADLNGQWEKVYVKGKRKIESIEALPTSSTSNWPANKAIFESGRNEHNDSTLEFQDFFFIDDAKYERVSTDDGSLKLRLFTAEQNPEISSTDRARKNAIAIPEIFVSRINARHVAVSPNPEFRDRHGKKLLDSNGHPQIIETTNKIRPIHQFKRDASFERKLLIEYFDRNHTFRTSSTSNSQTAAASHGRGLKTAPSLNEYLRRASKQFRASRSFENATLLDYANFILEPADLKGISAHSTRWSTSFGSNYDRGKLERLCGNRIWRWHETKHNNYYRYTPSFADQKGTADAYLYRTMYENKLLKNKRASLFIHNGCEVNTPDNALRVPYSDGSYASGNGFQNAESILFFSNGVALASRAKVFYDLPREFTDAIRASSEHRFGTGWMRYFLVESNDARLSQKVASRKRSYFWSIIGDWTIQVK